MAGKRRKDEDYPLIQAIVDSDDAEAFRQLYEKYKDRVYATAYRISGRHDHAMDITQDVFQRVYRQLEKFHFRSSFSSWLYKVAVNICLDHRRHTAHRMALSLDQEGPLGRSFAAGMVDPDAPRPESDLEREEFSEAVQDVLQRLGPKLRSVVVLRYLEGLSYMEIAEALGLSMGTVKSRLNRAHEELKPHLGRLMKHFARVNHTVDES